VCAIHIYVYVSNEIQIPISRIFALETTGVNMTLINHVMRKAVELIRKIYTMFTYENITTNYLYS